MRSRVIGLLMSVALCMPACLIYAQAPTPEVHSVVRAGFDSLKAAGFEAGIRGWLKGLFDCYQSSNGWIVTTFLFNAQPALILPPEMLRPH